MTNVSLTTVPSVAPRSCGKHGGAVIKVTSFRRSGCTGRGVDGSGLRGLVWRLGWQRMLSARGR